jgi:hypothetical protein
MQLTGSFKVQTLTHSGWPGRAALATAHASLISLTDKLSRGCGIGRLVSDAGLVTKFSNFETKSVMYGAILDYFEAISSHYSLSLCLYRV